jgi:hypothetical protein
MTTTETGIGIETEETGIGIGTGTGIGIGTIAIEMIGGGTIGGTTEGMTVDVLGPENEENATYNHRHLRKLNP